MSAHSLILALILTAFSIPALAHDKTDTIKGIEKVCSAINKDKGLKKVVINSKEHVKLTGFYKGRHIRKIISISHLDRAEELFEYYFEDDKLIFVYEQFSVFIYSDRKRTTEKEQTFSGRYYFACNHMVHSSTVGHNRFEDDSLDPGETLLKEAEEKRRLLSNRK